MKKFVPSCNELAPSLFKANVCSYLQLVALAENVWLELGDIRSLLRQCGGDIRRCLLQLQLWARSGGGQASQSGGLPEKLTCEQSESLWISHNVASVTDEDLVTKSIQYQRRFSGIFLISFRLECYWKRRRCRLPTSSVWYRLHC